MVSLEVRNRLESDESPRTLGRVEWQLSDPLRERARYSVPDRTPRRRSLGRVCLEIRSEAELSDQE